ncbi:DNA-binding transcriptional regulator GbsR (MarR family) [Stackebrandtia albiflava]|uniref:DNA-binding transcriptional regulator GbsR (MarR family) n=1 Tax=Stackebrandtia albiflava TaxID=406432 RepID=A0A562UL82_9ACTN|nr:MarR family transcriptional regulator [Stackebrandtia albiflava]TWJ06369.1 DNA-binding transcriptional regulator GbsR (MarR family) [Stackebrandtia albiflava]
MTELSIRERELVGRFGLFTEMTGGQRIPGMLVGYLLICAPEEQSITEIATALNVSKASVSTVMRQLQQVRAVERVPVADSRQHYYRLTGNWIEMIRARWRFLDAGRDLAEAGMAVVADDPRRRERMRDFADFLSFLVEELGNDLTARWEAYQAKRKAEREAPR